MTMEEASPHPKKRAHKTRPAKPSTSSTTTTTKTTSSRNQGRFRRAEETEDCSIECTGKGCQACSATLVADCVALCCCPLAVVSLLVLTFIKVPYVMGRRCIGRRRRRNKEKRMKSKDGGHCFESNGEINGRVRGSMERSRDIVFEFGEGEMLEERKSLCTGLIELDNVLLELYQVGHLGFGRVSFTGIQPNAKPI